MRSILMFVLAIMLVAAMSGCGSSSTPQQAPPTPVSVTLTETTIALETSPDVNVPNSHTFIAVVQHAANPAVTWAVNGIPGGDGMTNHGTISASGVYTAPAWVPSDAVTVTATSQQDPTKSASAAVNLSWYVGDIQLWTGYGTQVETNGQLQIDSYVSTKGPQTVTWTVNGVKVGSAAYGALVLNANWPNSVFYTAPSSIPNSPYAVTITATSNANASKSASASIAVVDADPSQPKMSISPNEVALEVAQSQQFSATVTNGTGPPAWSVMKGAMQLENGRMDSAGNYTAPFEVPSTSDIIVTASLSAYPADKHAYAIVHVTPPAINPTTRVNGNYVFALHDPDSTTNLLGVFTADGNGHLSGTATVNSPMGAAVDQPFTGTCSFGADGRGLANITYTPAPGTSSNLAVRLMMTSDNFAYAYGSGPYLGVGYGTVEKQTSTSFDAAAMNGSYAFLFRGLGAQPNPPGPPLTNMMSRAGVLTADGKGNLTGSGDVSSAGTLNPETISGTYTVSSNGLGTATLTLDQSSAQLTSTLALAMVSPSKLYVMTTDNINTTSALMAGTAEAQAGPFDATSLSGSYAFYDHAYDWAQLGRFDSTNGNVSNGMTDERDSSTLGQISIGHAAFTGTYTTQSNGRVALQVVAANGNGTAVLYLVSPQKFFILVGDSVSAAAGEGYAQQDMSGFDWASEKARYAVQLAGRLNYGVGWVAPYWDASPNWLGWIDYDSYLKNETSFDFYSSDPLGTGTMFVGFNNGSGLPEMRYYLVSDSKLFMIYTFPTLEPDEFVIMDRVEP